MRVDYEVGGSKTFVVKMPEKWYIAMKSEDVLFYKAPIISTKKGNPKSVHDEITTRMLDKYSKQITALPPDTFTAKRWLTYYVRVVDKEMRVTYSICRSGYCT